MLQPAVSNQQIDALLEQLTNSSEKIRAKAVEELAGEYPGIDDPAVRVVVAEAVLKALGDEKWPVRKAAALILPHIREAWATDELVSALAEFEMHGFSYDKKYLHEIGEALERVGTPALESMANRFLIEEPGKNHPDFWVWDDRVETANKYFRSVGEAAIKYAIAGISTHPKYPPTFHLLVSFGKAAEEPLLDLIKKEGIPSPSLLVFHDNELMVSRGLGAAAVLGNKNDEAYKEDFQARIDYAKEHWGVEKPKKEDDYKELFLGKNPVSPAMLTLVALQMVDFNHYHETLVSVLKQIGQPALDVLVQDLRDRPAPAHILGLMGDPAAIEPLSTALANAKSDWGVRITMIQALGWIGGATFPLYPQQSDWVKRLSSALPSGRIGDPSVVRILLPYLKDTEELVRIQTADVFGALKDPQATGALLEALNDEKPGARKAAAQALGMIGDPKAVPGLIERLTDKGGKVLGLGTGVGDIAAQALERIGTPDAMKAVQERKTKKR